MKSLSSSSLSDRLSESLSDSLSEVDESDSLVELELE
jgi:hypothetical protein